MNPNPFKHVCYVQLFATVHVCLVDRSVNNAIPTDRGHAENPLPCSAYLGPLDPHWQSPGSHFGGCSHSMDGASLCTTSGGTGVLFSIQHDCKQRIVGFGFVGILNVNIADR